MIALRAPSHAPTGTPTLPHANTRAAGASHALLHAHRVKTARTSPRARKHAQRHFRAVPCASALCWRPMAGPRRPHQPRASRTTRPRRTTTHADARAAVHLSLQSAPIAQAPAPSSGTIPHRSATRPARRFTARRARRHAARAGHRARAPPHDQGCCTTCCRWCSSPACSEHSARVLRCAPAASRLHDADPALHEARAWHAARALRHPFSLLSSLPAHSTEHMQGTQGTCARRAVSAQRCSPHPATVACLT